jgi:hypothetical protein
MALRLRFSLSGLSRGIYLLGISDTSKLKHNFEGLLRIDVLGRDESLIRVAKYLT